MTPADEQALAVVANAFCSTQRFKFTGLAGHGTFKATYRVEHPNGQVLALKVYLPGAVTQRAVREIDALTALSKAGHRSLPAFLALAQFDYGGKPYIISAEEFLEGGSLTEKVARDGPCNRSEIVGLARQISSALVEVAGANLVHRDIKPDNLVFRSDGTIVLVDFGLVRNLDEQSLTQTWLARGPGTPLYAAPEQLNNDKHLIDWRTDQFSLGVSLSFVGRGRHPYARPADTLDDAVGRVAAREPVDPDFVGWASSEQLGPIVRMVEAWPVSRYRRPADLVSAWDRV